MKKKENETIESVLQQAKLDTLTTALEDILKIEYFKPKLEGAEKAEVDFEFTLRMARTRARMTLDVVKSMNGAKK